MVNDVGEVGEEVALVLVGEDCWDTRIVEFDGLVVNSDEVDSRVASNERRESIRDNLRDGALGK